MSSIDLPPGEAAGRHGVGFSDDGEQLYRYAEVQFVPVTPDSEADMTDEVRAWAAKHGIRLTHTRSEPLNPAIGDAEYEAAQWTLVLSPLAAKAFEVLFPEAARLLTVDDPEEQLRERKERE